MLETLINLPTGLLWLSMLALPLAVAALIDRMVTAMAGGRWRKAVRGVLPTVTLPVMLLAVAAAAHLAYDAVSSSRAAADNAMAEARLLREAIAFTRSLDEPVRGAVLTGLRGYTERVIDRERGEMRLGTVNPASGGGLLPILDKVMTHVPATPGQRLAQGEVIARLKAIADARQDRLAAALRPLGEPRWGIALFLAVLTLLAAALSHSEFPGGRRLSLAILALTFGVLFATAVEHTAPYGRPGLEPMHPLVGVLPLLN